MKYHPKYFLLHTDDYEVLEAIKSMGGYLKKLASWDVYDNYYGDGQQVRLMQVNWDFKAH